MEGSSCCDLLRPAADRESGLKYFGQSKIEAVVTSVENVKQSETSRALLLPLTSTCPSMVNQEAQGDISCPGKLQPKKALSDHPSPLTQETSQCEMKGPGIHRHSNDSMYWYHESRHSEFQDSPCHWRCGVEETLSDVDQTTAHASKSLYSKRMHSAYPALWQFTFAQ
eukprot:gnl/MRDRNA2_/MRDRNA2_83733_c0_seq2.p1 gnl/MRDRNA2_/MRDRNA2_83733_c0~~gnl/MRDRNA2_/MRDRNA2_83733_c0_seq2.p1  ORF type:complete len:180 (-),score=29.71 gnl/MRDRNA2_/MRDRNA2_83733_c0_seq2:203-706(-)